MVFEMRCWSEQPSDVRKLQVTHELAGCIACGVCYSSRFYKNAFAIDGYMGHACWVQCSKRNGISLDDLQQVSSVEARMETFLDTSVIS